MAAPARPRVGGDEVDAPPDAGVAEVVRVPGERPEPAVHHLALVGRVGLERRRAGRRRSTRRRARPARPRRPPRRASRRGGRRPTATWIGSDTKKIATPWREQHAADEAALALLLRAPRSAGPPCRRLRRRMCEARRSDQAATRPSRMPRRSTSPSPSRTATTATTRKPRPQVTSTTDQRPVRRAARAVDRHQHDDRQRRGADDRRLPRARGRHPRVPGVVVAHREDLVDAHAPVTEGHRATDEVEPPHAQRLLAEELAAAGPGWPRSVASQSRTVRT